MTEQDAEVEKRVKRKKDRKGKGKAVDGIPAETDEVTHKLKKEKKKKERKDKIEAQNEDAVPNVTPVGDSMDMDLLGSSWLILSSLPWLRIESCPETLEPPQTDSEKKKKKRKRGHEATEDDVPTSMPEKKKKKRKTEPSEETHQVATSTQPSQTQLHAAASGAFEHKKDKKSKKDKTRSQQESSPSGLSSKLPSISSPSPPSADEANAFLKKHSITIYSSSTVIPIMSFGQLDIPEELKTAFKGFKEPTPIQACAWPPALACKDVVGIAETGR